MTLGDILGEPIVAATTLGIWRDYLGTFDPGSRSRKAIPDSVHVACAQGNIFVGIRACGPALGAARLAHRRVMVRCAMPASTRLGRESVHNARMHVASTTVSASGSSAALLCLVAIVACTTASDRKAAEYERINQQAAAEVARICALHDADREAELKRLKEQSGMELYCPKD